MISDSIRMHTARVHWVSGGIVEMNPTVVGEQPSESPLPPSFRARYDEARLAAALEAFQANRHLGDTEAMRKALEAAGA